MASINSLSKTSTKNGRIPWPEAASIKQQFSLPDSIVYYISKNPSKPEVYQKLAKSCKYFFEKNPILIIKRIYNGGKKCCSNDRQKCYSINCMCCITIDIAKITTKIWLTDEISLYFDFLPNYATLLISKIYECENALLFLFNCELVFKEFKLFASKFQKFCLKNVKIIDADGKIVMFETIIESILNVKEFEYHFYRGVSAATSSTMASIMNLKNFDDLCYLRLHNIPKVFNVKDLSEFLKNHKNTKFWLHFEWNISEEYKNQLDQLADTILTSGVVNHAIYYSGLDWGKYKIMRHGFTS